MTRTFILAFQNNDRSWFPIGKLCYDGQYSFEFLHGVTKIDKLPLSFGEAGLKNLIGFINARVMTKGRVNYKEYLGWLDAGDAIDPLDELAKTYGAKVTDNIQLFEIPQKQDNKYIIEFFCQGMRYLPDVDKRLEQLQEGNRLYMMSDFQNKYDNNAFILRTEEPVAIVGYCPRIFAEDFKTIATQTEITVTIRKINLDAPLQLRLLCRLEAQWPENFEPFQGKDFEPFQGDIKDFLHEFSLQKF